MGAGDVAAAYERARAGFAVWRRANPLDRAAVLSAAAGALQHGCYVEPTIISVSSRHALRREEVFGPVVAVCQASGFDEAVGLASDSRHGLSAAAFTTSLRLASEFIDRAEAGQVAVNLPTSGWDVHHPFGGFRDSGSAFKEQGAPGLRFYTRLKTAAVRFAW